MKTLAKIIISGILIMYSHTLQAQPGRGLVKQPPRIPAAIRIPTNASINATAKAKIHANSNSVYGTGGAVYKKDAPKKEQVKQDAIKDDGEEKKGKGKKQK